MTRLRDLGIVTGTLPPGQNNAITDVAGVRVGVTTLIEDSSATLRTGVTAIWPGDEIWTQPVFAGPAVLNGNGEMTGLVWLAEQGLLSSPICLTNTFSVGLVRDAICAAAVRAGVPNAWHLPVAAETYDGWLSDSDRFAVTPDHVFAALDGATGGAVPEGNVGGGTGMICHDFKGGTGTASRVVTAGHAPRVVGALVQANYGRRADLRVDGVAVGRVLTTSQVPAAYPESGSIIVILATDAPLLPIQCQRLARRATTGLAWVGGIGNNSSGDMFLAFSTGNRVRMDMPLSAVDMLHPEEMSPLFQAAAEATEEAILNALIAAETMTGRAGRTAHALPHGALVDIMSRQPHYR